VLVQQCGRGRRTRDDAHLAPSPGARAGAPPNADHCRSTTRRPPGSRTPTATRHSPRGRFGLRRVDASPGRSAGSTSPRSGRRPVNPQGQRIEDSAHHSRFREVAHLARAALQPRRRPRATRPRVVGRCQVEGMPHKSRRGGQDPDR
jgi:hypothetical protein